MLALIWVGAMLEYQRRMPHFQPDHVFVFITWRLWGSLPQEPSICRQATAGQAFAVQDRALDRGVRGPLWLREPVIAKLVADAIIAGEREKHFYELAAWVVMPNHVHVVVLPSAPLPVVTQWLKGFTARQANRVLGRSGRPFWQDESYDHWVRNRKQLDRIVRYVESNPVSAGLVTSVELWPWSSAARQVEAG